MPASGTKVYLGFYVSAEYAKKLRDLARQQDRSKSALLRKAVELLLARS